MRASGRAPRAHAPLLGLLLMREAIRGHQRSSELTHLLGLLLMREAIRGHQRSSELTHLLGLLLIRLNDGAVRFQRTRRLDGLRVLDEQSRLGELGQLCISRLGLCVEATTRRDPRAQRALRGHSGGTQRALRWHSEGTQRASEGTQRHSEALRGHSEGPRGHSVCPHLQL